MTKKISKKKNQKKTYKDYQELLYEDLKDPTIAKTYLNEALQDDDERVILLALKDVIEAQGKDISALARKSNIERQSIYRILSKKGNPRWTNINALLKTLGYHLRIK